MTTADDHDPSRDRWRRVEALYLDMLTRPAAERAGALEAACAGDLELAAQVQSLLDAPESGAGLLAAPLPELAARLEVGEPGSLSGRRVGHFDVQGLLGAGGMGEVYRARDSRLGRAVAIKVLPPLFTSDPDRRTRFEREARVLASLSHPNIGTLYGLEESDGVRALVLELVEGETLAARIAQGPLSLPEALSISKQIAEGLDAAHEKGIVHRDLKPANIMLTPDGVTKILDFGLAKLTAADASDPQFSKLPTATSGGTREGVVLGTTTYMSPEQTRGRPVDKRADIWAFGCILHEMLTGSPPFHGATAADTTAAILEREPDWNALPAATPRHIRRLLESCLAKDSRQRLRDIGDASRELAGGPAPDSARVRRPGPAWLATGAISILALLAALGAGLSGLTGKTPTVRRLRLEVNMRPGGRLAAISPDGTLLTFVAADAGSPQVLWVRPLDSLEPVKLLGTEGALHPFWSPDSRWIGFFARGKLRKIEAKGGTPVTLADVKGCMGGAGASWGRGGAILFGSPELWRVSESGGEATKVTELDASLEESCHAWPSFLPDGRHFLYLPLVSPSEKRAVYLGSLDSPRRTRLLDEPSQAVYAEPGFVLFGRQQDLMARPFDARRLTFTGEAKRVAESLVRGGIGRVNLSVSSEGTLAYESGPNEAPRREWSWLDRSGRTAGTIGTTPSNGPVRLSPDGKRVAFTEFATDRMNLWIYDIDRGVRTRLTTDASTNHFPAWSPDGSQLVFDSSRGKHGRHALYETVSDGATPERPLLEPPPGLNIVPLDWSRDGKYIVFTQERIGKTPAEIWVLPRSGGAKPFRFLADSFAGAEAAVSPDGRWLAYTSRETGIRQVVVRSFPDPSKGKWQVSTEGGSTPRWRGDGAELYYLDPERRIVAVTIASGGNLVVGKTIPLFTAPLPKTGGGDQVYDVTPDGQRFLISAPPEAAPTRVVVVPEWTAGLKPD